jgi:predicted CopG family antitoxin
MSTKTVAVDSRVYERLASAKRRGESFSRAIDRLLDEVEAAHTGSDILARLPSLDSLGESDAAIFLDVVAENRRTEKWEPIAVNSPDRDR